MRIVQMCAVLLLAASTLIARAQSPATPLKLSSGTYKFTGRCTKLSVLTYQFPYQCADYMGIVADDPSLPNFVFSLDGKAWLYVASGPATLAQDGAVATYPITEMLDAVVGQKYVYPGECVMSAKVGDPLVHCTMWRDASRKEITREIEFTGDGNWMFSKKQP